eukprot:206813_1
MGNAFLPSWPSNSSVYYLFWSPSLMCIKPPRFAYPSAIYYRFMMKPNLDILGRTRKDVNKFNTLTTQISNAMILATLQQKINNRLHAQYHTDIHIKNALSLKHLCIPKQNWLYQKVLVFNVDRKVIKRKLLNKIATVKIDRKGIKKKKQNQSKAVKIQRKGIDHGDGVLGFECTDLYQDKVDENSCESPSDLDSDQPFTEQSNDEFKDADCLDDECMDMVHNLSSNEEVIEFTDLDFVENDIELLKDLFENNLFLFSPVMYMSSCHATNHESNRQSMQYPTHGRGLKLQLQLSVRLRTGCIYVQTQLEPWSSSLLS